MQLSARPLTSSDDDQALYVTRPVDDRVEVALATGANVLVAARRGSGATSMLNRLENRIDGHTVVSINAAEASSAEELIGAVAARSGLPREILGQIAVAFSRLDPLAPPTAVEELKSWLREHDRRLVVLIDGPIDAEVSHDLFGRFRDDVFGIPAAWLVVAHEDHAADYLEPPADVFFEHVDRIDGMDSARAKQLLRLRGVESELPADALAAIIDAHDGTPRGILALARGFASRSPEESRAFLLAHAEASAALDRGPAMLLAELQGHGPASATDAELISRLGVTTRQLRRYFDALQEAGLVEVVPSARQGPGRPPTTYMLTALGRIA